MPARFDPRLRRTVGQVPMRYGAAVPMPAPVPWPTGPVHVVVVDPRGLGDAAYVGRNFSSAPAFPDNAEWSAFAPWEPAVAPVDGAMANEIQGDILADSEGRLYERRQSTVRPVFDMRPVGLKRSPRPPLRPVVDPAAGPRWLRLGEWRAMLAPQLAQPDRLRDGHLLACALRVFEVGERMPADHVSKQLMNGAPRGAQVVRLTVDLAVRLSLEAVCEEDEQGSGAEALPGDRFLRIDVIEDSDEDDPRRHRDTIARRGRGVVVAGRGIATSARGTAACAGKDDPRAVPWAMGFPPVARGSVVARRARCRRAGRPSARVVRAMVASRRLAPVAVAAHGTTRRRAALGRAATARGVARRGVAAVASEHAGRRRLRGRNAGGRVGDSTGGARGADRRTTNED